MPIEIYPSNSIQVTYGVTTVANEAARLALVGLGIGAVVYQSDTGFFYTLLVVGGEDSAGSWSVEPKVYRAYLTQSSTDAPTVTVFENTLGGVPDSNYIGTGEFSLTGEGLFPANCVFVSMSPVNANASPPRLIAAEQGDVDLIHIVTNILTGDTNGETSVTFTPVPANGQLAAMLEILVYPA